VCKHKTLVVRTGALMIIVISIHVYTTWVFGQVYDYARSECTDCDRLFWWLKIFCDKPPVRKSPARGSRDWARGFYGNSIALRSLPHWDFYRKGFTIVFAIHSVDPVRSLDLSARLVRRFIPAYKCRKLSLDGTRRSVQIRKHARCID